MTIDPTPLVNLAISHGAPTVDRARVIGIRASSDSAGAWDDRILLVQGSEVSVMVATTDPGRVPMTRQDGTAILQPGYYPGLWKKGLHRGSYPAGVQVRPCKLWRDDVSDGHIRRGGPTYQGLFGINLHHARNTIGEVGNWSEGCQVLEFVEDLGHILSAVDETFDYFLADADDEPELCRPWLSASVRTLPVLRKGSRGAYVARLQRSVGVQADGVFGDGTERALKVWQHDHGLAPDGVAGPITMAAMMGHGL